MRFVRPRSIAGTIAGIVIWVAVLAEAQDRQGEPIELAAHIRRPIALACDDQGKRLLVANQRSGSLSVIDLTSGEVELELPIGKQLSDLKPLASGWWLVADQQAHQLILLRDNAAPEGLEVVQRLDVAAYPVGIEVFPQGRWISVASLWSRRLTLVAWDQQRLRVAGSLDLSFAPRLQCATPDAQTLIVADAFANRLGVVDVSSPSEARLKHVHRFPCHNIRGLRISPDGQRLVVAYQMLNELAHTTRNDVHWGLLMSNDVRLLKLAEVLRPEGDLYRGTSVLPLGQPGNGAGDPSALVLTPEGEVLVSLGGVGEFVKGLPDRLGLRRTAVGRRPTAIALSTSGQRAWVANAMDDAISEVDLKSMQTLRAISLGPQPQLTLVDQGEMLFYDSTLSHDGWLSCHSCHTDGHSNGMLNDNFSDDSFGAPKSVLSILGRAETEPFGWTGNAPDLATQIRKSISGTMQSDDDPREPDVLALEAFILQLPAPPALDAARGAVDAEAVERGRLVFHDRGCAGCHAPPRYTSPATYKVGLTDQRRNSAFNPPTLLGVSQRELFFHDGRALALEDVARRFQHQLAEPLEPQSLHDLLAFLRSL